MKKVYVVQYYGSGDVVAVFNSQDEALTFADDNDPEAKILTVDEYKVYSNAQDAKERI